MEERGCRRRALSPDEAIHPIASAKTRMRAGVWLSRELRCDAISKGDAVEEADLLGIGGRWMSGRFLLVFFSWGGGGGDGA